MDWQNLWMVQFYECSHVVKLFCMISNNHYVLYYQALFSLEWLASGFFIYLWYCSEKKFLSLMTYATKNPCTINNCTPVVLSFTKLWFTYLNLYPWTSYLIKAIMAYDFITNMPAVCPVVTQFQKMLRQTSCVILL